MHDVLSKWLGWLECRPSACFAARRHLFNKVLRDYDKLMGPKQERQAFLEPYKQFKLFRDASNGLSLEEFADAREVRWGARVYQEHPDLQASASLWTLTTSTLLCLVIN
jgi:hypothetical protein